MGESGCLKARKFLTSWTLKVSRSHFTLGWAKEKLVICPELNSLLLFLTAMLVPNEMLVRRHHQAMLPVTHEYLLYEYLQSSSHVMNMLKDKKKNPLSKYTKENKTFAVCFVISLPWADLAQLKWNQSI